MQRARAAKRRWAVWRAVVVGALAVVAGLLAAGCSAGARDAEPATTTTTTTTAAATATGAGATSSAATSSDVASSADTTAVTSSTTGPTDPPVATVVAAGDIACAPGRAVTPSQCQMEATAALAESLHPDVVLPLGDLQYETGRAQDFAASYDRTWGRLKAVTHPVPGNHEYAGGKATGYYGYFGAAAHPPDGWYSFDLGPWHLIVLNSVCAAIGGCGEGSREYEWLRSDLEATTSTCIVAAWHHPRWSSGLHHSDPTFEPFWQLLAQHGADLVLSGHDHHYERFSPKDGIVQLVVGTGGRSLYPAVLPETGTVTSSDDGFGVLQLDLRQRSYTATFRPVPGFGYTDETSAGC